MNRSRLRAVSVTIALATASLTVFAQTANAAKPAPQADPWSKLISASILKEMRAQDRLDPAVTLLNQAAAAEGGTGFASVAFEGAGLTLYYKGPLSLQMSAALQEARAYGEINVHATPYSRTDLEAAAARLEPQIAGTDYQSIDLNYQTGTITIESMPAATKAKVTARAKTLAAQANRVAPTAMRSVQSVVANVNVGVPILTTTATTTLQPMWLRVNGSKTASNVSPAVVAYGRNNDFKPYDAGGVIRNYDAPVLQPGQYFQCTSGFGVHSGSTTRVLTAAHCGTPPDAFYDGGSHTSTDLMGNAIGQDWDKDIMTINATAAALMFTGAAGSSTTATVNGWGYWSSGELLCQSGAKGGEECALKTGNSGTYSYKLTDSDGDTFYVHGMILAVKQDSGHASVPGDSGGPVFTINSGGVHAKGVLSGGDTATTNSQMLFQDMADVINDFGSPVTS